MELSKLGNIYMRLCEKYSLNLIDTDNDTKITQDEILIMAYQDEDLKAELNDDDLELIKDYISTDDNKKTSSSDKSSKKSSSSDSSKTDTSDSSDISQLKTLLSTLLKSSSSTNTELLTVLLKVLSSISSSSSTDKTTDKTDDDSNKYDYECLKTTYKKYLENCDKVSEKAKNGDYSSLTSQQLDIDGKSTDVPLSSAYWNGQKETDKWSDIKLNDIIDINKDGELTMEDLKLLPDKSDLDGDGKITDEEKTFLEKLKVKLYYQLKNKMITAMYSNTLPKIDDIISYLDIKENDETISKAVKSADSYLKGQGLEDSGKAIVNENSYTWSKYGIESQKLKDSSVIEERYKNLIMKTDLTKEQLNEILNKLNSSSSSVQSQLSEVKSVIETKLGAMD